MNAIRQSRRIALGALGVSTLRAHVLMGAVAFARNVREPLSIAVDSPRLSKGYPLCAWRLADQPVHAAIDMMSGTAPPLKAGPHVAVAPVCAGLRPL